MTDKQFEKLFDEIVSIKRLLILNLQHQKADSKDLLKTLGGISKGRLSQIMDPGKYEKRQSKKE